MKLPRRKRIGFGLVGLLFMVAGVSLLFTQHGGGTPGSGGFYVEGLPAIVMGLLITALGAYVLYKVITAREEN